MPSPSHSGDEPDVGVSDESVRQGLESLATNAGALTFIAVTFLVLLAGILWGISGLLDHDLAEPREADVSRSVAPALTTVPPAPLQPMPGHDDLDWQDLEHLRQREDARLWAMGSTIDPETGQAVVPTAVADAVTARYAQGVAADPLRFPPVMAAVQAGPDEPLSRADVFPPVGAAAAAEQTRESIYRPSPGPREVEGLPTQTGPPGAHDRLTTTPTH